MRGELVIVRDFRSEALIRRVWDSDQKAVYITDDQQFERLLAGQEGLPPVGFPREDVFEYDPSVAEPMSKGSIDWRRLKPYKGGQNA
jgi:hypothetical protein